MLAGLLTGGLEWVLECSLNAVVSVNCRFLEVKHFPFFLRILIECDCVRDAGADGRLGQNNQLISRQKWTVIVSGCWLFSGGSTIGTMSTLKVDVWIKTPENRNKLDSRESLSSIIDLSRLIEKMSWPHFLRPPQNTGDFSFLFPCRRLVIGVIGIWAETGTFLEALGGTWSFQIHSSSEC